GCIDDLRIRRRGDLVVWSDGGDLRAADQNRSVLDLPVRDGKDSRVASEGDVLRQGHRRNGEDNDGNQSLHRDLLPLNWHVTAVVLTVPSIVESRSVP